MKKKIILWFLLIAIQLQFSHFCFAELPKKIKKSKKSQSSFLDDPQSRNFFITNMLISGFSLGFALWTLNRSLVPDPQGAQLRYYIKKALDRRPNRNSYRGFFGDLYVLYALYIEAPFKQFIDKR